MFDKKNLNDALMEYAQAHPTKEVCGFVVDGRMVVAENQHSDPTTAFKITDPLPDGVQGLFHSHPDGPFYPSEADMQQQQATDLPWAVVCFDTQHKEVFWFGGDTPVAPIVGRGFRHGVTDCCNLIVDFYAQQYAVTLPNAPRNWEWWNDGQDLYNDNFENAGFYEVSKNDILPGDIFLASIKSKTHNHGGVYLGNGLILHHISGRGGYDPSRLSTVEPGSRWFNHVTKVLRHENTDIDRSPVKAFW